MRPTVAETVTSLMILLLGALSCVTLVSPVAFGIVANNLLSLYMVVICTLMMANISFKPSYIACCILWFLYFVGTLVVTKGGLGSAVTIMMPIMLIFFFSKAIYSQIVVSILRVMFALIVVVGFLLSLKCNANRYEFVANNINPNTISLFVLDSYMLFDALGEKRTKLGTILSIALFGMAIIATALLKARMALLTLFVYLAIVLVLKVFKKKTFATLLTVAIIVLGTIFPLIYLWMYNSGIELVFLGKSLYTGREDIWQLAINGFEQQPLSILYGLGSKAELWSGHSLNVHNNYWAVIVNFGLIGHVIFYGTIVYVVSYITKRQNDLRTKKIVSAFICGALVLGFTEVSMFWAPTYLFICLGLGFALNKSLRCEKNEREKNSLLLVR